MLTTRREIRYMTRGLLCWTGSTGTVYEIVTGYAQAWRQRRAIKAAALEALNVGGTVQRAALCVGTQMVVVEEVEFLPQSVQELGELTVAQYDAILAMLRKERDGGDEVRATGP